MPRSLITVTLQKRFFEMHPLNQNKIDPNEEGMQLSGTRRDTTKVPENVIMGSFGNHRYVIRNQIDALNGESNPRVGSRTAKPDHPRTGSFFCKYIFHHFYISAFQKYGYLELAIISRNVMIA